MKPIISVEKLGKRYSISREAVNAPMNFREVLSDLPRRLLKGGMRTRPEEFWAVKDVSFDIMPGERVGIIGRNGAGKSTLLKLLSRITEPTEGRIALRGRTASLLEVGTGFHPELTGRENIYLNGAILGMSRAEVSRKFDEVVDFAGIEKFLDTPVKRYSSGMYVRLGFAVAAHLEPEILIVDEVLAVGDMEFQKKCLGKMEEVSKGQGRTVLFVSHNLGAIQVLCTKGVLLQSGTVSHVCPVAEALVHYLGTSATKNFHAEHVAEDSGQRFGTGRIKIRKVTFYNEKGESSATLLRNGALRMDIEVDAQGKVPTGVSVTFTNILGIHVAQAYSRALLRSPLVVSGRSLISICYKSIPLIPGEYYVSTWLGIVGEDYDFLPQFACLEISTALEDSGKEPFDPGAGNIFLDTTWEINGESIS